MGNGINVPEPFLPQRPDFPYFRMRSSTRGRFPDLTVHVCTEMPRHVRARTVHALARRYMPMPYSNIAEISASRLLHVLGFAWIPKGRRAQHARAITDVLRRFWASSAENITEDHLPEYSGDMLAFDEELILRDSGRIWEMVQKGENPQLPMTHDGYLKVVSLAAPRLPFDIILMDESQDMTPALIHWIERQEHAQQVFVGDPLQAIYQFRGAVDAMDQISSETSFTLSESFRFGSQIANLAARWIRTPEDRTSRVVGHGPKTYRDNQEVILGRTNWGLIQMAHQVITEHPTARLVFPGGLNNYRIDDILAVWKIWRYGEPNNTALGRFNSFQALKRVAEDVDDLQIKLWCKIVEELKNEVLHVIDTVRRATVDEDGDVWLTTIHKAKGMEYPVVILADDLAPFTVQQLDGVSYLSTSVEDRNLWYVAVTRAQQRLVLPSRSHYEDMLAAKGWIPSGAHVSVD